MVPDVLLYSYFDANFAKWGSLRVINEDRVQPGTGYVNRTSPIFFMTLTIDYVQIRHAPAS